MSNHTTICVPLTRGLFTIIDAIDQAILTGKLQATPYKTSGPYATKAMLTSTGRRPVKLHRIIMERMLGRPLEKHEHIDHADGDPLNNRRRNLRICSHTTNAMNAKKRSDNKSGFKGVCLHKATGLWRSYITVNKRKKSLGYYRTPEEAHEAYKRAALEYYGEFARFE